MDNEVKLYCPACDKVVAFNQASEICERNCPGCGAAPASLWPSKAMFDRDKPKAGGE
jgi:endogenous inhibitor of DNA gyrase (YacG/DUF329 family)